MKILSLLNALFNMSEKYSPSFEHETKSIFDILKPIGNAFLGLLKMFGIKTNKE